MSACLPFADVLPYRTGRRAGHDSFLATRVPSERVYCPICGRALQGPRGGLVPYPMHVCAADGVVYDQRRQSWYGVPEVGDRLFCPACGHAMESEPPEPPKRLFFCYQCGVTFDRVRNGWYGLAFHEGDRA